MPAAIRFVGGLHEDGWSGLMAANAALARVGRDRLCEALGVPRRRRTRCSARWQRCRCRTSRRPRHPAQQLQAALFDEDRIEVPVLAFPVRAASRGR